MIISIIYFIASLSWTHHSQSWNLSNNPQGYSAALRSQNRSYKSVQTPLDQFPRPSLFNKLRHRQEGGDRVSAQGKLLQNVDHARIKRSPQLLTFPTCRSMTDQNASSVYLCKALTVPSLYTNNKGATEWGTICQRAKSIFTSHSLLWKNSWNELGFRRTGGSLPVGPSPHPLSRVCAGAHRGPTCPPSVLSSRHPESTPKPQSSTIALMLLHSAWHAGAEQRWGRMSQIGPIG